MRNRVYVIKTFLEQIYIVYTRFELKHTHIDCFASFWVKADEKYDEIDKILYCSNTTNVALELKRNSKVYISIT